MFNKRGIKVLYLGILGMGIGRSLSKEDGIKNEVKCIRKNNTVSFYKKHTIFKHEINITVINIARTNAKCYEEIILKEIDPSDNVIIMGDDKRKKYIKEYIEELKLNLSNYIDVEFYSEFIERSKDITKEVLNKEIMSFFIRKLLGGNLKKKGVVYLSPKGVSEKYGKTILKILEEYKDLQYNSDLRINIISNREYDMDELTYIIDPIYSYMDSKSCIEINNIINKKDEDLYFLMLGIN